MNNVNGAALLARVRPGDLVTIRKRDGSTLTGRASRDVESLGALLNPDRMDVRDARGFRYSVTAANIVAVRPGSPDPRTRPIGDTPTMRDVFGQ